MAYITGTTFSRFTSTTRAAQGEQTAAISSRHGKPLEQATSTQAADSSYSARSPLTHADRAQDASGPIVISSKSGTGNAANPPPDNSSNSFENLGALEALVARYQRAEDVDATTYRPKAGQLFELSLKTRDGDSVTLSIGADFVRSEEGGTASLARETNFSFVVAGELSDREREAVDALLSRLADIAHAYQENGWADVEFLDAFDSHVLAELDLKVAGDNNNALTIAYSQDADAGVHTLAVNQNGYEYALDAETPLDQNNLALQENALYQQYQKILTDTTRSYKAGEILGGVGNIEATEFFLDGLEAILSPLDIEQDVAGKDDASNGRIYENSGAIAGGEINSEKTANETPERVSSGSQEQPVDDASEKAFLSGLPDFSASFNTPAFSPNASEPGELSQMSLNMEQVTDISIDPSSGVKTLTQHYSYDSRVSQHFGIGGDSMEHANLGDVNEPGGQTYLYEVVEQSTTLTRTVDIDPDGRVIAYGEDKDSEHTKTTKEVVEGNVTGFNEVDLSDPRDNYSFSLQVIDALVKPNLHAAQADAYVDVQTLMEAIESQRIDLYS